MDTIGKSVGHIPNIIAYGDWIALNPKHSGYFDDRDKSGVFLHQFDIENESNKAQVPIGRDISRIEHAVSVGRLFVLPNKDAEIPLKQQVPLSNRTRAMLNETKELDISPKPLLHNTTESTLLNDVLPNVTDQNILEQLLQLETNGDNSTALPRARVVDYLTDRIKEYAKHVTVVDTLTNEAIIDEEVEEEGQEDFEFAKIAAPKTKTTKAKTRKGRSKGRS